MNHKEIALKLYHLLEGTLPNHGWWAQGITVAYEQHIGRRVPGQRADGTFEVSVSKTYNCTMDAAFTRWHELTKVSTEFNGVKLKGVPTFSETEKWRNWRVNLMDGTKIVVGINQKTAVRAGFGLAHQKLTYAEDVEAWRQYWREFLSTF